jgi:hypothetical protein
MMGMMSWPSAQGLPPVARTAARYVLPSRSRFPEAGGAGHALRTSSSMISRMRRPAARRRAVECQPAVRALVVGEAAEDTGVDRAATATLCHRGCVVGA